MKIARRGWTVVWVKKNGEPLKKQPISRNLEGGLNFWMKKYMAQVAVRDWRTAGCPCVVRPATMEVFLGD